MILALQGLAAGAAHVFTGPDHLVGVAPLAVDRPARTHPALVGATWGLGHGVGVALLGILGQTALTLGQVEVASGWAERLVGFVLVVMGLVTMRRARSLQLHEHTHVHDGHEHTHLHVHAGSYRHKASGHRQGSAHTHRHAAFGVGIVHGLAGAGHFWAVLPSLAMEPRDAAIYIGAYLGSSVLAMTAFGAALGGLTRRLGVNWVPRFLTTVGLVTAAVGVWWAALSFGLLEH
ncbi:MAG: hydantoin utilization protein A [Planctomycetota bacterium]